MKRFYLVFMLLALSSIIFAQRGPGGRNGGQIEGRVMGGDHETPIEYANIVLFSSRDSSQVTGAVTGEDGKFLLTGIRPGNFYLRAGFIGYQDIFIYDIEIRRGSMTMDLGDIYLDETSINIDDVVVEGERAPISYEIDKKVINVKEMHTAISGNATDVLENVPSVQVDIEGNVSLRGSGSFTVLIDGRPTPLDANDALQQIPAASIENIEIITNPSAKYDPEGVAGIINVILKKTDKAGYSGLASINGGQTGSYGAEGIFSYKKNFYNINLSADYNNREFDGNMTMRNEQVRNGSTYFVNSSGDMNRGGERWGFRGSVDFTLGEMDMISIGGRLGSRSHGSDNSRLYNEWSTIDPTQDSYLSATERERSGNFYQALSFYEHKFNNAGHRLTAEAEYSYHKHDESTHTLLTDQGTITSGQINTESGPENEFEGKFDYTLPFSKESKFEAGFETEMEFSDESTGYQYYDTNVGGFVANPLYANTIRNEEISHSLYSIYANQIGVIGFQAGVRGEYTGRLIELKDTGEKFEIDEWDFFPSVHTSYDLGNKHQIMASYTRRIDRPRSWYLEPFITWIDRYNIRQGNPALDPEYINSYELGYQTFVGKSLISIEAYIRETNNKIERIRTPYEGIDSLNNVTFHTMENVGEDRSIGVETMFNFDPVSFWNVNLMGNVYDYSVEGNLYGRDFSNNSFNWSARFNNMFKISENTQVQFNVMYHGPSVTSQGREEGFLGTSASFRQNFFEKKLALTLQVRDLFSTANHESTSTGPGYYSFANFERQSPMVMLNLQWNFNNFKQERDGRGEGGGDDGGGMDDSFNP